MLSQEKSLTASMNRTMLGRSRSHRISACSDLIGMPYVLGADGNSGAIDCIHLVYQALRVMEIPTPPFKSNWYEYPTREILRDINQWGMRVEDPTYDGDVSILPDSETGWAFGVTWCSGILYINRMMMAVTWCPIRSVPSTRSYRYSPTKER